MSYRRWMVVGLMLGAMGCAPAGQAKSGGDASFFEANVAYRDVKPSLAARRLQSPRTLTIVLGPQVADDFTLAPSASMKNHFSAYRKTVGETLKHAFAANFSAVEIADKESGQGLELVIVRAEMQPTTTIKYGIALLSDGKELLDVTGQSAGKTLAMRGNADDLRAKYTSMIEELADYTLNSLAEKAYDQVMRADELQKAGFYDSLSQAKVGRADAPAP